MDKLFSNIQQNLTSLQNNINQDNNKKTLLQRQQISQDKINELLEKSSQAMLCGPTCQKLRVTDELKQKYLDAETNMQTAPLKLEQSKKNYYIFTEGRPYYDNMREEELKKKANMTSQLLAENFNDEISSANTMNTYLNTALINSENTKELLKEYLGKNQLLKVKLRERHGDILTNDRKTYYETEAYENLLLWYRFFWWIYYIVVLMLILGLIFSPSYIDAFTLFTTQLNNQPVPGTRLNLNRVFYKILIIVLLIFYPYYIDYVIKWIYGKIMWILNKIPKNVYNNL
jgi:hypothetical protein